MMPSEKNIEIQPFLGGFILETLTIGMYGESRNAIREYVQNSFDSIQQAREKGLLKPTHGRVDIELSGDGSSLCIRDDGIGLSSKIATATLTSVGASKKDYRTNAGFRGIGRLSGIVFSDTVTFTTKVKGESHQTVVVFDGAKMRASMTPRAGGSRSAEQLLQQCVTAKLVPSSEVEKHFFEVRLDQLTDPPVECTDFNQLKAFLSQVAPVPYSTEFKFHEKVVDAAAEHNLPIDEISIFLREGTKQRTPIFKPYSSTFSIESGRIGLKDIEIIKSPKQHWWGWVGKKRESGAYTEAVVRGLRVRLKNIQVDGTDLMREIFQKHAASYSRFQDWFVGEIFADPQFLVPNARRDGFEENPHWKDMRRELGKVAQRLGKESYDVSSGAQLSVASLEKNLGDVRQKFARLKKAHFKNVDQVVSLSDKITGHTKKIAQASQDADLPTVAKLQAMGAELADIKRQCLANIPGDRQQVDIEQVQQAARDELVKELVTVFDEKLSPRCASEVREILSEYLGQAEL